MELLSQIGGAAGIVALIKVFIDIFNARSNRNTIDLDNMQKVLQATMDRYDKLEQKFDKFQQDTHAYVEGLRTTIVDLQESVQQHETKINNFEKVVNTAYRCRYPENLQDCPVIAEYEKRHLCEECVKEN